MYAIGDYVMHKNGSICRVDNVSRLSFCGDAPRDYLVLETLSDNPSKIYLPISEDAPMPRRVMNKAEAEEAIREAAEELRSGDGGIWREDTKARAQRFAEILESGDRAAILKMVAMLYHRRDELKSMKKKMYASDERILNAASKAISAEFAFVLGISPDELPTHLASRLDA